MTIASSDPPFADAAAPVPGLFQRLSRALPAVLFLVGGAMAMLAYLVLPWVQLSCYEYILRANNDTTRDCLAVAAAHQLYPIDYLGPLGSVELSQPPAAYLTTQLAYFGPAVLCLLAVRPALEAHRSMPWRRAGLALGTIGGLYGLISVPIVGFYVALRESDWFLTTATTGFYVALAGFAIALLGAVLLWLQHSPRLPVVPARSL